MDLQELESTDKNQWPIIWCELNAKDIKISRQLAISLMRRIEEEYDKKSILKYWNEQFIPFRKKKRQVLSQLFE